MEKQIFSDFIDKYRDAEMVVIGIGEEWNAYLEKQEYQDLLAFYAPYISKCCLRPLYDEYGNVYIVVDMELKP